MTVSDDLFEKQIAYLDRRHEIVSLENTLQHVARGARLKRPIAAVTFDDGYRSVLTAAKPILDRAGISAHCFVCTDHVGTEQRFPHDDDVPVREFLDVMSWDELRELQRAGWGIGAHTASHARLSECAGDALEYELRAPVDALHNRLGVERPVLAYPFGGREDISPEARTRVPHHGYVACLSDYGGENRPGDALFELCRIDIGGDHSGLAWKVMADGVSLRRLADSARRRIRPS